VLLVGVIVVVRVVPIAPAVVVARRRGPMVSLAPVTAIEADRTPGESQETRNQDADSDTMEKSHKRSPRVRYPHTPLVHGKSGEVNTRDDRLRRD